MKTSGSSPNKKRSHSKEDRKPRDKKPFSGKRNDKPTERKYAKKEDGSGYADHHDEDRGKRPERKFAKGGDYKKRAGKPFEKSHDGSADRPAKRYDDNHSGEEKKRYSDKPFHAREKKYGDKGTHSGKRFSGGDDYKNKEKRPYEKHKEGGSERPAERYVRKKRTENDRPYSDKQSFSHEGDGDKKPFSKNKRPRVMEPKTYIGRKREYRETEIYVKDNTYAKRPSFRDLSETNGIRLNKFIANAGICSRREADTLIETGVITINGKVVTKLGTKVMPGDVVKFNEQVLTGEQHQYLLLNKPKGYLTTTDDPQERKTVMEIIRHACKERIYPVGRLDKNTSGLLLFTNDGELAKKLTHPSHRVEKIYHAELDKPLQKADMLKISEGIELEDGLIKVDAIAYGETKKEVGIEIHSGKNRIVRRIFESLGYEVVKLDRVVLAGLTKKDLPRGKYRFLSTEEVNILRRIK
ncbi:MAG TPA: pseudouridine synthase [Bacteroidales bacterium]|nr:pseudouridine synthase [Bacteroidales bacterium]